MTSLFNIYTVHFDRCREICIRNYEQAMELQKKYTAMGMEYFKVLSDIAAAQVNNSIKKSISCLRLPQDLEDIAKVNRMTKEISEKAS